jgi:hypothetical protein
MIRNKSDRRYTSYESSNNGATFGPLLTLATNGTIGEAEEGG